MKMKNKDAFIPQVISVAITLIISGICFYFNIAAGFICIFLGAVLTAIAIISNNKRYKKLNELNNYLSSVCSGNFDLDIEENTEGELSILKNNLYKVIVILRSQNEMLKKDKLYLSDSLADISHQLKTPLTSIMVMTDLLKDSQSDEKRAEFISVIENQSEKMKWLITNLLKLSRLDAGTVEFKTEKVSIDEVIKESLKPFMITLDLKNINLNLETEDFLIQADKNWTAEAFENIIKNCIEHTPPNGCISIKCEQTNLFDFVTVSDNGCGIEPEELPHIFERFYRGKNSSTDSVGIGLALSKAIFGKQKASLAAQSKVGEGTTFKIKFYKAII